MDTIYYILTGIIALACLVLVPVILLQKKRDAGFSGAAGGNMGSSDSPEKSHFDKTKKRTLEGKLERYTKLLAIVFMVLTLIVSLMV